MATRKNETAPETEEVKQEQAPEQEQKNDQNLASEVETLKSQYDELKALLQQAIVAMSQSAEKIPDTKAEEAAPVQDMTGESMAEDEGTEWEEYETVRTYRALPGQEKSIVVSVNDRNVQIPLDGREYRVRKPHAEIFRQSMDAAMAADKFAESVPHNAEPEGYDDLKRQLADLRGKLKEYGVNV